MVHPTDKIAPTTVVEHLTHFFTVIWLRTYDHSGNGLLIPISSKGSFICIIPSDNTYHGLCNTSRGALTGTRNSSMGLP